MKKKNRRVAVRKKHNYKECGAISCINNIYGICNNEECQLHENHLIQED
ncbi:MAG: hypothetical protein GX981_06350 [Tissierellia bacterium]|nr:hypothetical protein [Tissierellia bacterium]